MKKRYLKEVPIMELTDDEKNFIKKFSLNRINHFVKAKVIKIDKEKILVLSFFSKDSNKPSWLRVFLNKEDYIIQEFTEDGFKWRNSSLYNFFNYSNYGSCNWIGESVILDDNSSDLIKKYLGSEEEGLRAVWLQQEIIMKERLEKQHKGIKDAIDREMKVIKKLPKDFVKWVDIEALYESRYIIYEYKARKKLKGYCTHCKTDILVEGARHNISGICPNCNSHITYKASGKIKNLYDTKYVSVLENSKGTLIARYFYVFKDYYDYRSPVLSIRELARDFYTPDLKQKGYEWSNFKQTGEIRWCENRNANNVFPPVLYTKNLKRVLKKTPWQYSAIKEYAQSHKGFEFPLWGYLKNYIEYPMIEYLVKVGLTKLTHDIITYSNYYYNGRLKQGKDMFEILGLSKVDFNTLRRLNGGISMLGVLQKLAESKVRLTDEELLLTIKYYDVEKIIKLSKYTTINKIFSYTKSQSEVMENMQSVSSEWLDYLSDCKVLGYDISKNIILFPRYLKEAHIETNSLIRDKKNEIYNKRIEEMYENISEKYGWEYEDTIILAPKSYDDLIKEGANLNHCVARNYGKSFVEGKTIILFIRKKATIDKPFFTLEISPDKLEIKQIKGFNNKEANEEVKSVLEKYKKLKLEKIKKVS